MCRSGKPSPRSPPAASHPIAARARALLDALETDLADEATPLSSTDDRCAEALAQAMTLYVKLASHLGLIACGDGRLDHGQLIAWLKRDLALHRQTLAALEALADRPCRTLRHPRSAPGRHRAVAGFLPLVV